MNNRAIFDLAVGEIFGKCYDRFPVRIEISCLEIALVIAETYSEEQILESNDLAEEEAEVVFETVDWLVKAGYLWVSAGSDDLRQIRGHKGSSIILTVFVEGNKGSSIILTVFVEAPLRKGNKGSSIILTVFVEAPLRKAKGDAEQTGQILT